MSEYIGNQPATAFETVQKQISTSNSGTTITLDRSVTSVQDILLTIDAVVQSYDNYSVSGTTLTVGGTLSNNRVEILYVGRTMQSVDPTDDSVSAAKIKTDAVTTAKIQNDAITVDKLNLISTSSVPSLEAKGTSGVTEGYIQLNCAENSHGIKLKSPPHSAGASYTLTFPNNDGDANQFLQTDGNGVLSFANAGGGKINQVIQTTKTDTSSITSSSFTEFDSSFRCAITPSATSSKILVTLHMVVGGDGNTMHTALYRGTSHIFRGDASGSRPSDTITITPSSQYQTMSISWSYLDSPNSTSEQSYRVYGRSNGSASFYINRTHADRESANYDGRSASSLTVMEVLA
tara:strand:+ start:438 stop:1481 length:1044 start_codon:yes stop_codon:yes gene_type:complete